MDLRCAALFIFLLGSVVGSLDGRAQQTAAYTHDDVDFREGLDLFDKQMYSAAQKKFNAVIDRIDDDTDEIQINAEYYAALCALELFNKDADYLLRNFISDHPESPKVRVAYFQLGKYNYRRKKWDKAIEYFEQVDRLDLTTDEVEEYHFKLGYSYFEMERFDEAKAQFYEIKNGEGDYRNPALYYYSHLAYDNGDYQAALEGFLQLQSDEVFGSVVPYYISQIYYLQGKYEEVIAYAPPLVEAGGTQRTDEIARIVGESYYRLNRFEEAIPYLEEYHASNFDLTRDELYQLGYAYYRAGMFAEANDHFEDLVSQKDYLSQISYYHMADCYLRLDEKQYARNAFKAASDLDFDEEVKEDALYNYAMLAYELSYNPYDEAIRAFQEYIDTYPDSDRKADAYDYLLNVYMTTHNYSAALESLEAIGDLDVKQKQAYQVVAFNYGVELYHDSKFVDAIESFKKVKDYPIDQELNAKSMYWVAECSYLQKAYTLCIQQYAEFMLEPGAFNLDLYNTANYNIGYAYMKQEKWDAAKSSFSKYTKKYSDADKYRLNDAYLRIGDCYLMLSEISSAIEYYNKAIMLGQHNADYGLYQVAYCHSLNEDDDKAIEALLDLITDYPSSMLKVNAKFDLATIYKVYQESELALDYYQQVVNEFPNNALVPRSLLEMGAIYFQTEEYDLSKATYHRVITQYEGTEEAAEALNSVMHVFISMGDYEGFLAKYGDLADHTISGQDSLTFQAAYNVYEKKGCNGGTDKLEDYLNSFPNGIFANEAHFRIAECQRLAEDFYPAISHYEAIIAKPTNVYTSDALHYASAIAYFTLKDYQRALGHYSSLEKVANKASRILASYIGQMRCFYNLNNYSSALDYSQLVLNDGTSETIILIEAHFTMGMSAKMLGDYDLALSELNYTNDNTSNEFGAIAKYSVAEIHYNLGDYETSEDEIMELVQQKPSYDYWIAKGYILLADVYLAVGDTFQAKHTLQSIIDYYPGADLVKVAQEKLDAIIAAEQGGTRMMMDDGMEINLSGEGDEYEELFGDDPVKDKKDKDKDKDQEENEEEDDDSPPEDEPDE